MSYLDPQVVVAFVAGFVFGVCATVAVIALLSPRVKKTRSIK